MKFFSSARVILPGLIGNVLEWYEFSIYGYFAVDIAHQFFPKQDRLSSLLETFAVFAIGYFMRPLGAVFFGYCADRLGRKKVLPISIVIMAIATMAIGLIPGYDKIGLWAGVLLVFFRLLQGFAVGGEYSSSIVYVIEQTPPKKRGLLGSLTLFGAYFGMLLGSSVATLISYLAKGTPYHDFAWRIAFLLGIFLGAVGIYIRKKMPETPEFSLAKKEGKLEQNPLKNLIRFHRMSVLLGIGITILPAIAGFIVFSYLPTYTSQYGKMAEDQSLILNTLALIITLIGIPTMGYLSDRFGRFPFLFLSPILLITCSYFLFLPLLESSALTLFIAQAILGLMICTSEAVIPSTLASLFPVGERCSGIALSVNIANGFFGGTAALVATYLIGKTGNLYAPSWYIMFAGVISLISAIALFKLFRKKIMSTG